MDRPLGLEREPPEHSIVPGMVRYDSVSACWKSEDMNEGRQ